MNFEICKYSNGFFSALWPYEDLRAVLRDFGVLEEDLEPIRDIAYVNTYNTQRNMIFIPRDIMNFI